ncbi:hypothetical protein ABTF07_20520, partial [Acinetobacter baumannii]
FRIDHLGVLESVFALILVHGLPTRLKNVRRNQPYRPHPRTGFPIVSFIATLAIVDNASCTG